VLATSSVIRVVGSRLAVANHQLNPIVEHVSLHQQHLLLTLNLDDVLLQLSDLRIHRLC